MASTKPLRTPPNFPEELRERVLFFMYADDARCVYESFCPEWGLCGHDDDDDDDGDDKDNQGAKKGGIRFDTCVIPEDDGETGRVTTVFGHGEKEGEDDHECLPFYREDPRGFDPGGVMPVEMKRQLVREWVDRSLVVVGHEKVRLNQGYYEFGWGRMEWILRGWEVERLLPGVDNDDDDDDNQRGRRRRRKNRVVMDVLPGGDGGEVEYLYGRIRYLCINTRPRLLRVRPLDAGDPRYSEGKWAVERGLKSEWRATFGLDWVRMKRLEGLWVDLRIWSAVNGGPRREGIGFFGEVVRDLIKGLSGRKLKVLVVAGLESYEWGWRGEEEEIVEDDLEGGKLDEESGLYVFEGSERVNWFKTFREARAVRPGGRLVFVNKEKDPLEKN
ncbi:hypothetical protein QBC44DRAFT_362807 [Cladorrhinum sp. PSN332]|nr:hypothetical protein QBC44DRAFT_362807 [Cladorrhinum sp. PSN332]